MSPTEKEQFWQEHFKAWQASGLSQAEYLPAARPHVQQLRLLAHPQQPEAP